MAIILTPAQFLKSLAVASALGALIFKVGERKLNDFFTKDASARS
jgi:hypothetical protein